MVDRRLLATAVLVACSSSPSNAPARREPGEVGRALAPGAAADVEQVLSTGQSNAIGFAGVPVLSKSQPFENVSFDVGVMTAAACDDDGCREYAKPSSFVPLVEGDHYFNYAVETMSSAFANEATAMLPSERRRPILMSVHGRSGNGYECLRKSGCSFLADKGYTKAFDEALNQVADARTIASAAGKSHVVRAVTVIHGETDHYASPFPLDGTDGRRAAIQSYSDALLEWQRDYDADIRAITGQQDLVPLLLSQMSNWNDREASEIPLRQLEAHERAPGKVVLVGPTYSLPFAPDCIHFTSDGERRLGAYFAKAYARVVRAEQWEPLRPREVKLAETVIKVTFRVPAPPLVLDTMSVSNPGDFGFEVVDTSGSRQTITDVRVAGDDAIAIELASRPANGARLRYALRAVPRTCPGPFSGPRGNVRDSDDTRSVNGYPLQNWAVHFDLPID